MVQFYVKSIQSMPFPQKLNTHSLLLVSYLFCLLSNSDILNWKQRTFEAGYRNRNSTPNGAEISLPPPQSTMAVGPIQLHV